jgi:hypothetical protein
VLFIVRVGRDPLFYLLALFTSKVRAKLAFGLDVVAD